jgi:hypothetical protein
VGDPWRMYGVSKGNPHHKEGVADLPEARVERFECGICKMSFGRDIYADVNEFYTRHYSRCGVPFSYGEDWSWD